MTTTSIIIAQLSDFTVVMPHATYDQDDILCWLAAAHARVETLRTPKENGEIKESWDQLNSKMRKSFELFGCKKSRISTRSFDVLDVGNIKWDELRLYNLNLPQGDIPTTSLYGKDMGQRTKFFRERSRSLFHRFFPQESHPPEHIIHVSCTGYFSPSPAQSLVNLNRWMKKTNVTHAYHMGCYASIPSIRLAEGLLSALQKKKNSPSAGVNTIDIVHTEMCSLHVNLTDHSPEQIVIQSLFADGHIKYSLQPFDAESKNTLAIIVIKEEIIEDTEELMTWSPDSWGMTMTLSREVPKKIADHVLTFVSQMLSEADLPIKDIFQNGIFAIHPGGPKIIDSVQSLLGLREDQVQHSHEIFFSRGNMSSATLPHIWKNLVEDEAISSGKIIVSLAFGPGLTIFGSVMKKF
ncbi:3-oxoacyl-[acyl-carrier-protein] synthase III C-terminal domain-containing protein [Glaciimonas sp. GNP009]